MTDNWIALGERVAGTYLSTPFEGAVIDVGFPEGGGGDARVYTIKADQPINVSKFESMTIMRQRLTATLAADGTSVDRKGRPDGIMALRAVR